MSKLLGVEEVEITRSEKFLAFVLAAFLLIGGIWVYAEPLDRKAKFGGLDSMFQVHGQKKFGSKHDRSTIKAHDNAVNRVDDLKQLARKRREDLEFKRESYRTALDAGKPAGEEEQAYQRAQAKLKKTNKEVRVAERSVQIAAPAAKAAERNVAAARRAANKEAKQRAHNRKLLTFFLRLAFVLGTLGVAYLLFNRMRRRNSRYLPVAWAGIGFATALALVMATDYTTDYIDVGEIGPLVLSLTGITFTLLAIAALQRFLAKRTPQRRVRRNQCPFCGYPVTDNSHCEGCGRKVIAECSSCGSPRRVGSQHCRSCGKA